MSVRKQAPGWQRAKSEPAGEGAGSGIESWQPSQGLNFVYTHRCSTVLVQSASLPVLCCPYRESRPTHLHFIEAVPHPSLIDHHITHHYHKLWMKLNLSARSTRSITLFVPERPSARVGLALHWSLWSLPTRALHVVVSLSFTVSFRPKKPELAPASSFQKNGPPLPETWDENGLMTLD